MTGLQFTESVCGSFPDLVTKSRPNSILISEATYDHVSYMIDAEPSTPLVMDGKDTAIATYEVIGRKDPKIKPMRRTLGY